MMIKTSTEIKRALNVSIEIARKTGRKLVKYQKKIDKLNITSKEAQGVVSEADIVAEKFIIKELTKSFPGTDFLAEESTYEDYASTAEAVKALKKKEWLWVIDPLDGTTNYLNGMDYFAVCISLLHKGKIVTGVVYRPRTDELFYAEIGKGSFYKNGKSKSLSIKAKGKKKLLRESLLVTGFATEKGVVFDEEFSQFKKMMEKSRGIRRMGSAALDLCFVASGVFDGFWERGLAPWDMAAAGIICSEAGVKVTDYYGQKFDPFVETILAARNPVYKQISQEF